MTQARSRRVRAAEAGEKKEAGGRSKSLKGPRARVLGRGGAGPRGGILVSTPRSPRSVRSPGPYHSGRQAGMAWVGAGARFSRGRRRPLLHEPPRAARCPDRAPTTFGVRSVFGDRQGAPAGTRLDPRGRPPRLRRRSARGAVAVQTGTLRALA